MLGVTIRLPEGSRYCQGSAQPADLPTSLNTYTFQRTIPSVRGPYATSSPHRSMSKYRNINLLSIDYPSRVCLRTRLTLIRLTLIRKPKSIGGQVSHLPYRYLCLHLLFQTLHNTSRYCFDADWNAPLPMIPKYHSIASVVCLMPDYYPRTVARLVSCYALFK